jgi:hypothetical protein
MMDTEELIHVMNVILTFLAKSWQWVVGTLVLGLVGLGIQKRSADAAERQAKAAEIAVQQGEQVNLMARKKLFIEHGPKPEFSFHHSMDIEAMLKTGIGFFNFGESAALITKFIIEGYDLSTKLNGITILPKTTSFSGDERVRLFNVDSQEVLAFIVKRALEKSIVECRMECDANDIQEIVVTERRISRDGPDKIWKMEASRVFLLESGNHS